MKQSARVYEWDSVRSRILFSAKFKRFSSFPSILSATDRVTSQFTRMTHKHKRTPGLINVKSALHSVYNTKLCTQLSIPSLPSLRDDFDRSHENVGLCDQFVCSLENRASLVFPEEIPKAVTKRFAASYEVFFLVIKQAFVLDHSGGWSVQLAETVDTV